MPMHRNNQHPSRERSTSAVANDGEREAVAEQCAGHRRCRDFRNHSWSMDDDYYCWTASSAASSHHE